MRRAQNPPNPYLSRHAEWLAEDGAQPWDRIEVYEEQARSLLSENDSPDLSFRFSVNPYRGCQHACAYCYARTTHEYLGFGAGSDFERRLVVKVNAPELLARELGAPRLRGEMVVFSGVTDCYQPLEASYGLTRSCLEVCAAHGQRVGIVTKSALVRRDRDVLAALESRGGVSIAISLAFLDRDLARAVEPGTVPPAARLEAMAALAQAGLPVGVLVAPLIPGLNDVEVPRVLAAAARNGATFASFGMLRLPGSVEPVFREHLRLCLPERAQRIESRILEMRGGRFNDARFGSRFRGQGPYYRSIADLFALHCRRLGLRHSMTRPESRPEPRSASRAAARPRQQELPFPGPRDPAAFE